MEHLQIQIPIFVHFQKDSLVLFVRVSWFNLHVESLSESLFQLERGCDMPQPWLVARKSTSANRVLGSRL